jgi:hypothetical protein
MLILAGGLCRKYTSLSTSCSYSLMHFVFDDDCGLARVYVTTLENLLILTIPASRRDIAILCAMCVIVTTLISFHRHIRLVDLQVP